MKKLALAVVLLALLTVTATGAWANAVQITLSSSAPGGVSFTGTGGTPEVAMMFNGTCGTHSNCISGNALLEPLAALGTYNMWIAGAPEMLTRNSPGNYTVGMSSAMWLSVNIFGYGTFLTQVTLTDAFGGLSRTPAFEGTFANSTTTGFVPGFPNGVTGTIDFAVRLQGGSNNISTLTTRGARVDGSISSGEVVPSVPEPSSLALLGTGVLGLAGAIRRKLKR